MTHQLRAARSRRARRAGANLLRSSALCLAAFAAGAGRAQPFDPDAMSLEQLLQVTVVGATKYEQRQSEVAAAVSVITRQEIRTFGWRTLAEALASLPGVHVTYDRQYHYLGMRGFGLPGDLGTRTLVTINGNRVNDPVFDQGPVGRDFPLDLDLIERIEFIPGPGGAVYGQNAMLGVVNVVTRSGSNLDGTELSAHWTPGERRVGARASWGKRLDNGTELLLSASGLHAEGRDLHFGYGAAGVSGVAAGMDGERNRRVFARASRGPWSFHFAYGDHRKHDPTGAYLSDPLVPGQYQGDRRTVAQLQYQEQFADRRLEVLARLFAGSEHYSSHFRFGTWVETPAVGSWRGAELRLLSTAIANHKLMFGLEAQDNVRQDQFKHDLAFPPGDIAIRKSGHRIGLYVQDEWRLGDTLTATLGLRMDRDDVTRRSTSPRAALIWQVAPSTTLKALYGRAHRSPNAFERNYGDGITQVANQALGGETIDTMELVADHRIDAESALRASVYRWTMRDLVTLGTDPATGLPQYQSGDTVRARGVELSGGRTWPSGARLRASVSFQDETYENGGRLLNSPARLARLNASAPLPLAGLRAGYELRYDSRRLTLDGSRVGGHAISNLTLGTQALARGLDVSLSVYNLLDRRYGHPASRTNWQNSFGQDGRSVRLKLVYRF